MLSLHREAGPFFQGRCFRGTIWPPGLRKADTEKLHLEASLACFPPNLSPGSLKFLANIHPPPHPTSSHHLPLPLCLTRSAASWLLGSPAVSHLRAFASTIPSAQRANLPNSHIVHSLPSSSLSSNATFSERAPGKSPPQ